MEELAAAPAAKTHLYFGRDLQKEALARSDVVGAILARTEQRGTSLTLREHIFLLLADPSSSRTARAFGVLMWGTILATSFCFVYETMLWVTDLTGPLPWLYAKFVFQGFYTIETVLRFVTFIPFHQSIRDPFVWLDVVTVLPFWIRLLTVPASLTPANYLDSTIRPMTLRVFEGLAMFRLFKLTRYYEGSHLILRAVLKSITQLLVPLFMLFAMVMIFSAMVYEIEWDYQVGECTRLWRAQGVTTDFIASNSDGVSWDCGACGLISSTADGSSTLSQRCLTCGGYPPGHPECLGVAFEQTFTDLPAAMWFTIVTVTTVGYGDISPTTWRGQLFGSFVILCGIIFLAMPLAIVGNNFSKTFEERSLVKLQKRIRALLVANGISAADVLVAFKQIDVNGDGLVSFNEFIAFCQGPLRITLTKAEIYQLWRVIDINDSGAINFSEFTEIIFPHVNLEQLAADAEANGEVADIVGEAEKDDLDISSSPCSHSPQPSAKAAGGSKLHQAATVALRAHAKRTDPDPNGPSAASAGSPPFHVAELLATMRNLQTSVEAIGARMEVISGQMQGLDRRVAGIESGQGRLETGQLRLEAARKQRSSAAVLATSASQPNGQQMRQPMRQPMGRPMGELLGEPSPPIGDALGGRRMSTPSPDTGTRHDGDFVEALQHDTTPASKEGPPVARERRHTRHKSRRAQSGAAGEDHVADQQSMAA